MEIPASAKYFQQSDSFSLSLIGNGVNHAHETWAPGVFHQWATLPADTTFYVYLIRATFTALPLTGSSSSGGNMNAYIGIYDISGGMAVWVKNCGLGEPYVPQYRHEAQFFNAVFRLYTPVPSERDWSPVLRLTGMTPASGGPFQAGPYYSFDHAMGASVLHVEHSWHGAIAGE